MSFLPTVNPASLSSSLANGNLRRVWVQPGVGRFCAVGELAEIGRTGGAVLRRVGWFDTGLIHSSAESLH